MRIGLLADLHANREATEACARELLRRGCTQFVFLGDLVGYGADPGWVVDFVRDRVAAGDVAVQGNHDAAIATPASERMHEDARAAIEWTRTRLDEPQRAFLAGLPLQVQRDDRLYVHASAAEPARWSYVHNPLAARRSLGATSQWLTLVGHVHDQGLYYTGLDGQAVYFRPVPGVAVPLPSSRRWLAVVGSCGQPRDGNPAAACAWLDTDSRALTFLRLPYDHARAAARVRDAGLPVALAERLLTGG